MDSTPLEPADCTSSEQPPEPVGLALRTVPDPVLRQLSAPVIEFDRELHQLAAAMTATMARENGLGLAAVQVGVLTRVFVFYDLDNQQIRVAVNPQLSRPTALPPDQAAQIMTAHQQECGQEPCRGHDGALVDVEGCLSIPGRFEALPRPATATLTATDQYGQPYVQTSTGLLVRCWAHEIDHLDGILYTDHLRAHSAPLPPEPTDLSRPA